MSAQAGTTKETIDSRIGTLELESGYPSKATVGKLYDEMDFQRACQAYLWGLPAVGLIEWKHAHDEIFRVLNGQWVAYVSFDEKLGILTPNYTTPYIIGLVDRVPSNGGKDHRGCPAVGCRLPVVCCCLPSGVVC